MKKIFLVALVIAAIALVCPEASFAAETKAQTAPSQKAAPRIPIAPKANLGMLMGTISSIDDTDPADIKLTVKNDADGSVRTVSITPWTNITKVTDVSELKVGEQVRMMTRKADDKDVAMGIMFGKFKTAPKAIPAPKAAPAQAVKK